jgi:hypothetical protein
MGTHLGPANKAQLHASHQAVVADPVVNVLEELVEALHRNHNMLTGLDSQTRSQARAGSALNAWSCQTGVLDTMFSQPTSGREMGQLAVCCVAGVSAAR